MRLSVYRRASVDSDGKARFRSQWGVVGPGSESQGCAETPVHIYTCYYKHLFAFCFYKQIKFDAVHVYVTSYKNFHASLDELKPFSASLIHR